MFIRLLQPLTIGQRSYAKDSVVEVDDVRGRFEVEAKVAAIDPGPESEPAPEPDPEPTEPKKARR